MSGDEKSGFGWLHLTDLHVGNRHHRHLWENHESDLLEDLKKIYSHAGPWDLLFFTGDLTNSGSKTELESFDGRLSRVMETICELQGYKPTFLPVPGNHDLKRPTKEGGDVALVKTLANDVSLRDAFWTKPKSPLRKAVSKAFTHWTAWWQKWSVDLPNYRPGLLPGEYSVSLDVNGLKIGVLGLNSAALHLYDIKPGALGLDARQVREACGESSRPWAEKHDICFLLTHHPPDWLDKEGQRALDEDIYPPDTFALHLYGHAHEGAFHNWAVGAGHERGRLLGRSLFGLEWIDQEQQQERLMGYLAGRCWLEQRRRRYQLWPRSARRIAGGGGWQIVADTEHYKLVDDRATYVLDLRESPCQPAQPSPPPLAEASPPAPVVSAVARAETHVFNPLSSAPFSELCRGVRAASSTAALFADRLLIALKARPEHADLPYLIEALLLGKLTKDAAHQLHDAWQEGVRHYAPGAILPVEDALDPLHRLLSPVEACIQDLRLGLRGVITRPLPKDVLDGGRLALMREERRRHLTRFIGRESEVATIRAYLLDGAATKRQVVIVRAPEGLGKSAIVSKLVESLQFDQAGVGHDLIAVRRECDWLPGPLVVFGKKAERQPEAIVRLLLAQANAMLVQPVTLPTAENDSAELPWNGEVPVESDSDGAWANGVRARKGPIQSPPRPRRDRDLTLRSALNTALARLVEERGSAELVLDALDEISPDGSELGFIPDDLPDGSSMLLATRPEEGILRRLKALRPIPVNLEGIDAAMASVMTGLAPGRELSRILSDAQGSPLMMELVSAELQDGVAPELIDLTQAARAVFQTWVARWRLPEKKRAEDLRYRMLILFAIMEGVGPLSLNAVQGFGKSLGESLSQAEVRDLLAPVASHLDGLASGKPKLTTRKLAEFVWTEELGLRDRHSWMKRIVDWLGKDDLIEVSLLMSFLKTWTDPAYESDRVVRDTAGSLVGLIEQDGRGDSLYCIFDLWPKNVDQMLPAASVSCLRAAATLGNLPAMRRLGVRLLNNTQSPVADGEGQYWLQKAAEAGDERAIEALGGRLLTGLGMSMNVEQGVRWLRKAAEAGSTVAMVLLGSHLLEDEGWADNINEGERWLRKAAESGDVRAMVFLGSHLLDGGDLSPQAKEGERWIRQAAEAGSPWAMIHLSSYLFADEGVSQNAEEGERWLRKAADMGDGWAMGLLGRRLLEGQGVRQYAEEGEHWTRRGAEAGDPQAMGVLGSCLLAGRGMTQNAEEGERWLRMAAAEADDYAMGVLATHLLDGRGISQNTEEGERWLRNAAESGNPHAMGWLGSRLLDGRGLSQNADEGERWLRKAAAEADEHAMGELGSRLLDGRGMLQNAEEGESWLRNAAEAGDPGAMGMLGRRLLEGQGVSQNIKEGEQWLRNAAEAADGWAMGVLGNFLIDGGGANPNRGEGERWLRNAAEAEDAQAMRVLGCRLLEGRGVSQNAEEGEQWLRKAAMAGDSSAKLTLGFLIYERALGLTESDAARQEAGRLFLDAWGIDQSTAINLAYMLRRGEFTAEELDVTLVLSDAVKKEQPLALINQALHLIKTSSTPEAWREADALLALAAVSPDLDDVVGWWSKITAFGDPEGPLVSALLWRHGYDPADADQIPAMWDIAERAGWIIPAEYRGRYVPIEAPKAEE